jgi:hypothetical protein
MSLRAPIRNVAAALCGVALLSAGFVPVAQADPPGGLPAAQADPLQIAQVGTIGGTGAVSLEEPPVATGREDVFVNPAP